MVYICRMENINKQVKNTEKEPFRLEKSSISQFNASSADTYPEGFVISLDKPYGWTSADAVRKIKFHLQKHYKIKNIKIGHAGTLDPLATGILLICAGKGTKWAERFQSQAKEYVAEVRFGCTTPSYDLEKEVDSYYPFEHISEESVKSVFPSLTGIIEQIPPVFSAKLINGVRSYELARAGKETEMKPSQVEIYSNELIHFESPYAIIRIACSKGTYIRSYARDLGLALESGAHLTNLRRTASGEFKIENSLKIDDILKLFS